MRWLRVALILATAARVGAAANAATVNIRGDYYASLPGAYVETLNPTLWNSPDMEGAWGYHKATYFHGPTQYLTLYALGLFDSYRQIAIALMPLYAIVLAMAYGCMWAVLRRLAPREALAVPLLASTFLFFPLLQAYIQREFEVVVLLGLSVALWLLISHRRHAAAIALAYVAWFKYVPLIFAGYLGLRGWWKPLATFVATSAIVLAVTHLVFGLELFVNNNVPTHAAQVFNVWSYEFRRGPEGYLYGVGFCQGWFETETTLANVRHALCSLGATAPWFSANLTYLVLCGTVAIIYLATHARLERARATGHPSNGWRVALEFSIVTTVYATFLFNHYYYLIVLAIPFNVLLARYLSQRRWLKLAAWATAYVLVSAFVVPTSILTRFANVDVWAVYIKGAWFLYGELLLMALLLLEYWLLSASEAPPQAVKT